MTNNISLYFHIPFCIKKCDYCAFYSLADQSESVKQDYFSALLRQISCFRTTARVMSVYFGGGTPPILGIDRLCKLVEYVKSNYIIADDCEITVEINPKTIDRDGLKRLFDVGVNRLSVGVQSADDEILASIGRIHTFTDALECIGAAKDVGFKNISADIIFALPSLTSEKLKTTLETIMSTGVVHISAYSLQLEEGTPLHSRAETLALPDEDGEEEQYSLLCNTLVSNGFSHYEVSSFCKPGFESRHNSSYWFRRRYFGFGASAHSFFNGHRFSNISDVHKYIELTKEGLFAPTDYYDSPRITEREAIEEKVMLGLRTSRGAVIPDPAIPLAERFVSLGYGTLHGRRLSLNSRGFRISNAIIGEIISCLD